LTFSKFSSFPQLIRSHAHFSLCTFIRILAWVVLFTRGLLILGSGKVGGVWVYPDLDPALLFPRLLFLLPPSLRADLASGDS